MLVRERYVKEIRPFYESDLIKVITGIRRCGKSTIMQQVEDEIRASGKPTFSLNFEKKSVFASIPDDAALINCVMAELQKTNGEKLYVFLDEIQFVSNWNIACRSLRLENISLFITGSNSKLLSKEFTKELSGRYVSFRVRPFVYKEILAYTNQLGKTCSINDYLVYGGFPKIFEFNEKESRIRYLNDLDDTIIMGDIMNRYKIRKTELFKRISNFVFLSNAHIFSASAVQKYLRGQNIKTSTTTVMKYFSFLEEAYAIATIPQFSYRVKRELDYYAKTYDEDVAFNTIRQVGHPDLTHNLENIIFNELLYMRYELFVFNKDGQEIDFLARKDNKEYLIQVAYSIVEKETYEREFSLFNKLDQSRKKIIITNDEIDFSTSTVQHIPLSKFLLMEDLEKKTQAADL